MAEYNDSYRSANETSGTMRAAYELRAAQDPLRRFLPETENPAITYDFSASEIGVQESVEFRSFDSAAPLGSIGTTQQQHGRLPAASKKWLINEYDMLLNAINKTDGMKAAIDTRATQAGTEYANRVARARGEVITNGKLTINENGVVQEIDFMRPAKCSTSAPTAWDSASNVDIQQDIENFVDTYVDVNEVAPGAVMISTKVLRTIARNEKIIAQFRGTASNAILRAQEVREYLAEELLLSSPDNVIVNDAKFGYDAQKVRQTNEKDLVFLPASDGVASTLGSTQFGIPTEAFQSQYGISASEQAGIFGGVFHENDPESMYVLGSAIFLPVLQNAKLSFKAEVLG